MKQVIPVLRCLVAFLMFGIGRQALAEPSSPPYIQRVDTKALCRALGLPVPKPGAQFLFRKVHYQLPVTDQKRPHPESFTLAVYPTIADAEDSYRTLLREDGAYAARSSDEVSCIGPSSAGGADFYALIFHPAKGAPGAPTGHCRLRRANVVIDILWQGSLASAETFSKRVDAILRDNSAICPRGAVVPVPSVAFSLHQSDANGKIRGDFHTVDGTPIVPEGAPLEQAAGQGVVSFWPDVRTVDFATSGNVVFQARSAVSKSDETGLGHSAADVWKWKGSKLYFDTWMVQVEFRRRKPEWLDTDLGTFGPADDPETARKAAQAEIAGLVRPQWVPDLSAIQVYRDDSSTTPETVYIAAFLNGDHRVLYIGTLGKRLWQMIECPIVSGGGAILPAQQDVLRDEPSQSGLVEHTTSTFVRAQRDDSEGSFEPVEIELTRFGLSDSLDLGGFGYPFPHLPPHGQSNGESR